MPQRNARLLRMAVLFSFAAVLLGIYVLRYAEGGRGFPCPLLLLTGWQCPACGMTRAAASLLNGDFSAAFLQNALWPLYTAYLLWLSITIAACYVQHGTLRILPPPRWIHAVVPALALGYGVLRNLL